VDLNTVQGWEQGRRPLTSVKTEDVMRLRRKLTRLGMRPGLFDVLAEAFEADLVIADAVEAGTRIGDVDGHPLATVVHRRALTNLITWPFTGVRPTQFEETVDGHPSRRGPAPARPDLGAADRVRFFDHLLTVVDACRGDGHVLLRRQAAYLLGFDRRESSSEWLLGEQRRLLATALRVDHIPCWAAVRSSAIALARKGNTDALRRFVEIGLAADVQEMANLHYWAYWLGEISEAQADDRFMVHADRGRWSGTRMAEHLLARLHPGSVHADLNIHALWTLLMARPAVLGHRPELRRAARRRIEEIESDPDLGLRARRELASVEYAIRLADR
jgi:hypothetical protein